MFFDQCQASGNGQMAGGEDFTAVPPISMGWCGKKLRDTIRQAINRA